MRRSNSGFIIVQSVPLKSVIEQHWECLDTQLPATLLFHLLLQLSDNIKFKQLISNLVCFFDTRVKPTVQPKQTPHNTKG